MVAGMSSPDGPFDLPYSFSNPWLVNLSVRLFSVTVRTTLSGAPSGTSASISRVTVTRAPMRPERWEMTSSAIWLASRPTAGGVELYRAVEPGGLLRARGVGGAAGGLRFPNPAPQFSPARLRLSGSGRAPRFPPAGPLPEESPCPIPRGGSQTASRVRPPSGTMP